MLTDREFHWLKRRVFCTYCAKILVDPHTLTCLHSVCAGCVSKIRTLSGAAGVAYQCTVCDRFYDKIKPNFIIARLVSACLSDGVACRRQVRAMPGERRHASLRRLPRRLLRHLPRNARRL